jgi:hypothetical protein
VNSSGLQFSTLHRNEQRVEFTKLLPVVVTIADEVDVTSWQFDSD